jgi:hypothetical protein
MGRTVVLLLAMLLVLQACSHWRDRRDAPWDPRGGSLLEQIPNEEGGANRHCGGQYRDHDRGSRSPRC